MTIPSPRKAPPKVSLTGVKILKSILNGDFTAILGSIKSISKVVVVS